MPSISVGPNITASSQIVDGAIMNADINAAAAIALSKLAAGTQGGLPIRTAAGVMSELGAGTAGQVPVSQGAGADIIWGPAGAITRGVVAYTTNTTVTHGLGSSPVRIKISAHTISTNGAARASHSVGMAVISGGTIQNSVSHYLGTNQIEVTPANGTAINTTTGVVAIFGFQGLGVCTLSAVSSTQFTLTLTGGSETINAHNVYWECFA
jgi:hypothetical protein